MCFSSVNDRENSDVPDSRGYVWDKAHSHVDTGGSGSSRQHYCIDLDCPNKFYVKHTQDAQNVLTGKGWSLDTWGWLLRS